MRRDRNRLIRDAFELFLVARLHDVRLRTRLAPPCCRTIGSSRDRMVRVHHRSRNTPAQYERLATVIVWKS
jgi:hypothetical protein